MGNSEILTVLYDVVQDRKINPPEKSYMVKLLDGGVDKIASKITEEAGEFIEAAGENDDDHTVYEAADLLFHTIVMLGYKNIEPKRVLQELNRRFGVSGITEKENRNK